MAELFYRSKTLFFSGIVLLLGTMGCSNTVSRYESPKYSLVMKDGPLEVRLYEPALAASVVSSDDNSGFRKIFGFISGDNSSNKSISMTVPVRKEDLDESASSKLSFFMPSEFDASNLPKPSDTRVRVESYEGGLYGSVRFSGSSSDRVVERKLAELHEWVESLGYRPSGTWYLDRYDPPWTLPFLRRNEVIVRLDDLASDSNKLKR
jgi:hypothetical protein